MAINLNLNRNPVGVGRAAPNGESAGFPGAAFPGLGLMRVPGAPSAQGPVVPTAQPQPPGGAPEAPSAAAIFRPGLRPGLVERLPGLTPFIPKLPPFFGAPKTTTQIAQGAINLLNGASQPVLQEAINTIKNRTIAAGNLMNYLERKVIIGEALNDLAKDWSEETKKDFAEAFQTAVDKLDVMDAIVSVAILNDRDLEDEIRVESTPETTETDLLENRRIVWQYPLPGTILQPPYLILLAVEHRDVRRAEEVVQSIIAELVEHQGFKIPKAAAQKLR